MVPTFHKGISPKVNVVTQLDWVDLVGFYGILTIEDYLMPNPFHKYILDI